MWQPTNNSVLIIPHPQTTIPPPPCIGCLLASMAHKRCFRIKEPPQCPTYVDVSDPGYMGNLPLEDLVSRIEGKSSIKEKSKRRKCKGNRKIDSEVDVNVLETNTNATVVDSVKKENTVNHENCCENFGIQSQFNHQISSKKKPTATKTKKSRKSKGIKRPAHAFNSNEKLDLYSVAPVLKEDEDLVSAEEYFRAIFTDEEYETVMNVVKDPSSGINANHIREFQRQYPIEYLRELRAVFRWVDEMMNEEDKQDIIKEEEVVTDENLEKETLIQTIVEASNKENTVSLQKSCENITEILSNVGHQLIEEKEVTTPKKSRKNKKMRKKTVKPPKKRKKTDTDSTEKLKDPSEDVLPRRAGAILSDEEYMKSLLADQELFEYAMVLKDSNPQFDGKQPHEIQHQYPIDYLKYLKTAVHNFSAFLKSSTNLDKCLSDESNVVKLDTAKIENGSSDVNQKTAIGVDNAQILQYPNPVLDATPFHDPEEYLYEILNLSAVGSVETMERKQQEENKKKKEFAAFKNWRYKKETDTVIIGQAAPGNAGNLRLDDILERTEIKPLISENPNKYSEKKTSANPQEKKEDIVAVNNTDQHKTEKKEVATAKKKSKKQPTDSSDPDSAKKLNYGLEDEVQKAGTCQYSMKERLRDTPSDLDLKQHPESVVKAIPVLNKAENKATWPTVSPAERAVYGEVLKYYNLDKEKENGVNSSSSLTSPEKTDRRQDVEIQEPVTMLSNPDDEKEWLDYYNRKNRRCNCNFEDENKTKKKKRRSITSVYSGIFG